MERLPAHEDVVRRLALKNLFEFALEMFGCRNTRIRTFNTSFLVGALTVDPVAQVRVDQLLKRATPLAVGCGELVVVHQRTEAVLQTIPDVPDEWTLVEQFAMLLE